MSWFTQNKTSEYKERLLKSFPSDLRSDVESVVDILSLKKHDGKLLDGRDPKLDHLIHSTEWRVKLNGEQLVIPYRIYFDEPDSNAENNLTERQQTILNCIFLRHKDGYLREKRLKELVHKDAPWIIPFTIQLLGEYVYEILEVLEAHINEKTINDYHSFTAENPKYWQQTKSRMVSYWNEYYRWKFSKLKAYLGTELVKRINNRT